MLLGLMLLWTFGAVYYDGPFSKPGGGNLVLAILWLGAAVVVLIRRPWRLPRLAWGGVAIFVVLVPWLGIPASNDKEWDPEFAETGWVDVRGDTLVFHGVRNFGYPRDGGPVPRWETRTHHLSKLRGMDYFHDAFMGDLLAHPIMSFDFGEEGRLALSIETRREQGETFSVFGGLYKLFELQYIFGDERDHIRVRTNVRDEPVYVYRLVAGPDQARRFLLESIAAQNSLKENPRFYNVITHNCTTSIRAQTPAEDRAPWDIRMLANGRLDELLWEKGAIHDDGLPFGELRKRALINEVAEEAHDDPAFPETIRQGRPGFGIAD